MHCAPSLRASVHLVPRACPCGACARRRAYCSYADALFPPLWLGLLSAAASLRLLPLWQLLLLGAASFWGGLYVMAVRWAGVPPAQLGLSRVTPMLVVCLEALATGARCSDAALPGRPRRLMRAQQVALTRNVCRVSLHACRCLCAARAASHVVWRLPAVRADAGGSSSHAGVPRHGVSAGSRLHTPARHR
jgi:hypothetical protein